MSDLKDLSAATLAAADINHSAASDALEQLTSHNAKVEFARTLLRDARKFFVIDDGTEARLAAMLADPAARRRAEQELHSCPYRDSKTDWIGTGYSLIMDAVFAEDEPLAECHIVAIPHQWSSTLWHGERDLTDDGYRYYRWPYAELPYIEMHDQDEPIKLVMISENISGTLTWGGSNLSLYRGEITVRPNWAGNAILDALAQGARITS